MTSHSLSINCIFTDKNKITWHFPALLVAFSSETKIHRSVEIQSAEFINESIKGTINILLDNIHVDTHWEKIEKSHIIQLYINVKKKWNNININIWQFVLWERKHQVNHIFLSNLKLLWQCVTDATMLIYALRTIANVKLQNKTTDFILLTMFDQSKKVWTQYMTFSLKHFHHINVFPSHQIIKEEFTLRKKWFFFFFSLFFITNI